MNIINILLGGRCASMTSFYSLAFLAIFLPLALLIYALVPQKTKKYILLIISIGFYWLVCGTLIGYLFFSILIFYVFGLWLQKIKDLMKSSMTGLPKEGKKLVKKKYSVKLKAIVFFSVLIHIGTILTVKYSGFFVDNLNGLLKLFGLSGELIVPKFLIPLGISFFTLQGLSYIIDVSRNTIDAEKNILKFALFMSFFPQIVEGPICRFSDTAEQLWNCRQITYGNLTKGAQRILYGMLKKIVIADRLDPFVKLVLNDFSSFEGGIVAVGIVCYTIELYMDFSGAMDAVCGVAEMFGFTMPENFERPFFSKSISEFWQRWHVSLGTWFKDYIFYPIITSDLMKKVTQKSRKRFGNHYGPLVAGSIGLFCVWFCNGLWHGAGWNFIFFGMYHFILILLGSLITPVSTVLFKKINFDPDCLPYRIFRIIRTTILVIIGEMFFNSSSVKNGFLMLKHVFSGFTFNALFDDPISVLKIDKTNLALVLVIVIFIYIIGMIQEKGVVIRDWIAKKKLPVRYIIFYASIVFIIVFAAYGDGVTPVDPMYAQF